MTTTPRKSAKRINFTIDNLNRVKCPAGRDRAFVYDKRTVGLAYMVTANDARSFYFVRKLDGRIIRARLGGRELTIEQARKLVAERNGDVAKGVDPTAGKRALRKSETLQELFDRWIDERAEPRLAPRTIATDRSRFDTCFADWKTRRKLSITENDVIAKHTALGKSRGHVTANRAIQLLRKLLNFGRVPHNPAAKSVELFAERSRERFIMPNEMASLFKALDDEQTNPLIRDFIYAALFTGQRRSNVASMRIEEIDLDRNIWTVPASKTKSKRPIAVPLVAEVVEIIRRRAGHESGFIFASFGSTGHLVEPKACWKDVLTRAGISDLTLHDLRRSMGSYQAALGSSLPIIGASLGHQNPAATMIYSRLHIEPVRASVVAAVNAMTTLATKK